MNLILTGNSKEWDTPALADVNNVKVTVESEWIEQRDGDGNITGKREHRYYLYRFSYAYTAADGVIYNGFGTSRSKVKQGQKSKYTTAV